MDEEYVEAVLRLVEQVPPGRATTYGAIGDLVGGGPRLVGRVMSQFGDAVCWWRVVRADGSTPDFLAERAGARWQAEGTPVRARPGRSCAVDLVRCLHVPQVTD